MLCPLSPRPECHQKRMAWQQPGMLSKALSAVGLMANTMPDWQLQHGGHGGSREGSGSHGSGGESETHLVCH